MVDTPDRAAWVGKEPSVRTQTPNLSSRDAAVPGVTDAADIVGPTGEQMPRQAHAGVDDDDRADPGAGGRANTFIDHLLAEIERETLRSRRALECVPAGKHDWKPHEKSMIFGYLAHMVATIPTWLT